MGLRAEYSHMHALRAARGGASYAPIIVTVNVASNPPSQVTNQVSVSGGGSVGAAASDPTTIAIAEPEKVAIYRHGTWYVDTNGSGKFDAGDMAAGFGGPLSVPLVGNFNGTGRDTIAVYDSSNWYIDLNGDGAWNAGDRAVYNWGDSGAVPVVGDWNGSETTKIGVYANGLWFLDYNGSWAWDYGDRQIGFGYAGCPCTPVVADWNGDGRAKVGLFVDDGYSRFWYLDYDGDGHWNSAAGDRQFAWGPPNSIPVTGDWNGDGRKKVGVFAAGVFYLDYNGNGIWDQVWTKRSPGARATLNPSSGTGTGTVWTRSASSKEASST